MVMEVSREEQEEQVDRRDEEQRTEEEALRVEAADVARDAA